MSFQELARLISPKFNESVLINISKKYGLVENIKISNLNIEKTENKAGDSYLSQTCKFSFDATGKNGAGTAEKVFIPVFVKATPANVGRRMTYRSADFFETETVFYETVWPAILAYCDTKNLRTEIEPTVPRALACHWDSKNDFIALEDLSKQNFVTRGREKRFDFDSAAKVIKLFAKVHGASLAFKLENKAEFTKIAEELNKKESYFAKKFKPWYNNFQNRLFKVCLDAVQKELPTEYYNKLNNLFKDDFFNKICDNVGLDQGIFGVITQGDTWIPNFLFQNNENGGISDNIVIFDFQLARYASGLGDLQFFLLVCVDIDCLTKRWDDFLTVYHDELVNVLHKFGIKEQLFTLNDVKSEAKKMSIYATAMAVEVTPFALLEDCEAFDLNLIKGDEAVPIENIWTMEPFKDEIRRKKVAASMKFIVDKVL